MRRPAREPPSGHPKTTHMNTDTLLQRVDGIRVFRQGTERAPHKPLLILLALARWQHRQKDLPYETVRPALSGLLADFGPPRHHIQPKYPFVRLANDGIWQLSHAYPANTDPSDGTLMRDQVTGSFTPEVLACLDRDPSAVARVAAAVLGKHFPETLHEDILTAVGLSLPPDGYTLTRSRRDPAFRQHVLEAYRFQCAVCGIGVRLHHAVVALEAAHIQWHQASGPDLVENGLALCSLHHKLLDVGAFTITETQHIRVSPKVNGEGKEEAILRFDKQAIRRPQDRRQYPAPSYLDWHVREVFKDGYGR